VLKAGGHGLIIDLRHDATPKQIGRPVDAMGFSAINKLLTKPHMLAETNFRSVDIREDDIGFEISMTK